MAILTALELAKTYLIFKNISETAVNARVENALAPALIEFEQNYRRYLKNKLVADEFDSVSVVDRGNDYIQVELAHSVIKRLYVGYELRVSSGNYADTYEVLNIDTTNNLIFINAEYFDEPITFENYERQIYESALAWYICVYTRYTLQEVKSCTYMASSTQLGNGSTTNYSVSTLAEFKKDMKNNASLILKRKRFSVPL